MDLYFKTKSTSHDTINQGRRNERKSGPANAYVSRGGVWAGAPAFFFVVCFVLPYDLVHDYAIAN